MDVLRATQSDLIFYIYIIYFFYSLQGETLYYNAAQQHSLLGDELWVIAFGDNEAKSQTRIYLLLRHSAELWMLETTQHV